MEINLYNVFTTAMESYKTIFKSQSQSLMQIISILPAMERLYYLTYYLHIEKNRIQSIENYIQYLDLKPEEIESPQYDKDFWEKARVANSNFIHFLNQQIEIISLIDDKAGKEITKKIDSLKELAGSEIANVQVPSTLGHVSNSIFYLHKSIKIRNIVNLIIYLNNSEKLPKVFVNYDLIKKIVKHFSYKGENINRDTIKRYFSDIPTNLKKHLGELDNEYFIWEINQFLNKVLSTDEKD